MKRILFIFFVFFNFAVPVFAANWKQMGDKLYIDADSIEHYFEKYGSDGTKKFSFWIKNLNDKSSHFTRMEKSYGKKVWYILSRNIINCDEKMIANKSIIAYDLKSQVIDSYEETLYAGSWNSIVPDSVGELYYTHICLTKSAPKIFVPKISNIADTKEVYIEWGPYMRNLEKRIKKNWNPPNDDVSKRVIVYFKIGKDGRLISLKTGKSSGSISHDDAAKSAIERTAPFAPLPPEFKGVNIDIEFTFDYNVLGASHK